MATFKRKLNPELEKLRSSVPSGSNIDTLVIKLKDKTSRIHVSYLFSNNGRKLLKTLCLYLSSTKNSHIYSNWEELGVRLDVDYLAIKCIKYNFVNEDPAYYLFLTYAQNENAMISNIISALHDIKRWDIITQISNAVLDIPINDFKTKYLPKTPFVLSNIEDVSNASPVVSDQVPEDINAFKAQYSKTLFVTYANDANDVVKTLLAKLRTPKNNLKLGVITLDENSATVFSNPEQFIQEAISLVDYVIPIISKEYLAILSSNTPVLESPIESLDHKYVRYVYTLINTLYLRSGCRNVKVRSVIPNSMFNDVQNHQLMNNSIFQIWIQDSNVEKLIDRIVAS